MCETPAPSPKRYRPGGRLWHILATLADVEEVQGNEGIALNLRHEARTTLEVIIDLIPEGEGRASFVGLPGVAAIVGAGN